MNALDIRTLPKRPEFAPLFKRVESLGCSCELGFLQRHFKAEPLSLLRFAFTPLEGLLDALESDFAGIADPARLSIKPRHGEWMLYHDRYNFEFHTHKHVDKTDNTEVRANMLETIGFLTGVLKENLRDGEKLFVYRPKSPSSSLADRQNLLRAMQRFGRPQLMWLDVSKDPAKIGTAEWNDTGSLMTGYVDRFLDKAFFVSTEMWLRVIQSADALRRRHAGIVEPMRRQA